MKKFFFVLAAVSAVFLCITIFQLVKSTNAGYFARIVAVGDLKGFEDTGPNSEAFKELRQKLNSKISDYKEKEGKAGTWWLIISFLVTGLTGASTLISTVKAARNPDMVSAKTVKIIAILTFLASLGNWGSAQLSETRNKALAGIQSVKDLRSEFYAAYQQPPEDKKPLLIATYTDKLNDL